MVSAVSLAALLGATSPAFALPNARCVSCEPGGDASRDLLYRASAADELTLEWRGDWPKLEGARLRLYLGNPSLSASLKDRGLLRPKDGAARVVVPAPEVGNGTLIAVIVRENERGGDEQILSWEVFRLLDRDTHAAQLRGPPAHAGWELDLTPSVLRAERGGQPVPRAQGEDVVWWSLLDQPLSDLDLDGAASGLPGLSVNLSQPWLRREEGWRDAVVNLLAKEDGHGARYGELSWVERADVPVDGPNQRIQHYYAVVTIHTNASVRRVEGDELIVGLRPGEWGYFSHETSANLAPPDDPRLWSGYSVRELSEDPKLLRLLSQQLQDGQTVPGLPTGLGRGDGDGGTPSWQLGLTARVQRWEAVAGAGAAGVTIKAVDVVASRHGLAMPSVRASEAPGVVATLERWLVGDGSGEVQVDELPRGWTLALPIADPTTRVGSLALSHGKPKLAQRAGAALPVSALFPLARAVSVTKPAALTSDTDPASIEAQARVVLASDLRAGALVKGGALLGKKREVLPINAYAQFVLQIAVLIEDTPLKVAQANVLTTPEDGPVVPALPSQPSLMDRASGLTGVPSTALMVGAGLVGVIVVLALLVKSGLGPALNRVLMLVLPKPKGPRSGEGGDGGAG